VHAAGKDKGALDPFRPERPEDVQRLKELQREVHETFMHIVKTRRADRLKGPEEEIFSGSFWSARRALEYGLIDGITDLRSKMRALHGDKVRLKAVPLAPSGLLSRLRRMPGLGEEDGEGFAFPTSLADDVLSAVETRALWSRFGL